MKYLKIIRYPNLVIIVLTQYLLYYCVIRPFYVLENTQPALDGLHFALLVLSTILIAAAGYVINDCYDTETDEINKPGRVIVGRSIPLETAMRLFWIMNIAGILLGFYLSLHVKYLLLGFVFVAVSLMLWFYTIRYQKTVLWGNLAISLLSALVILIVWIFEFFALRACPTVYVEAMKVLATMRNITIAYALFAFLLSMIREILKDISDVKGDSASGHHTLPVAYGSGNAGALAAIITGLTVMAIGAAQYFLYLEGYNLVFWYAMIALQPLTLYLFFQTIRANSSTDYRFLSNTAKIIMVAGILSMQLFCISV